MIIRTHWFRSARGLTLVTVLGASLFAQPSESLIPDKKTREEFKLAEGQLQDRQDVAASFQRELTPLMEQKAIWQREVVSAKTELGQAKGQLERSSRLWLPAEIEKWERHVANWEGRLKAAVVELEKMEVEIHDKVQALHNALQASAEGGLILPGESLEVFVTEDETLNGVYQVRRGGYIVMPRVGRIFVAGKDHAGTEQAIKEALAVNQIRSATVMVERSSKGGARGGVIYLSGQFLKAGVWKVTPGSKPTIVTVILTSGGLRPIADLTKVRLLRLVNGQALVEEVNVQAIMNGAGLPSDMALQPGDIVFVPATSTVVYVTGNVKTPGVVKLLPDDELTVYTAILRSGGFARFANKSKVYILRDLGNGAKQKIPVSIKELQAGAGSDLILKSKDIVVVPEKFFSF